MRKAWGASDVGLFIVIGPTDVTTKPVICIAELVARMCSY